MPDLITKDAAPRGTAPPGFIALSLARRGIDLEARTVDFVASTDVIDTYGEVVDQGSWELDIYKSNPVVLFAHDSDDLPIGKCLDIVVRNGQLECKLQIATEKENPLAENVWACLVGEYLRAVSVGFIPANYRWEIRNGTEVLVLSGNSLREISVTPVPANHEALAKMRARAMAERSADTKTTNAQTSAQETQMDEATKAILATKDAELKGFSEKIAASEKALADLGLEAKTAKEALETATKSLKDLGASVKDALGGKDEESAEDACKRIVSEKAALADLLTERDVDALIGRKLVPAQKEAFLALAKKDRAGFDAIVAGMPVLNLTTPVIPVTKSGELADVGDLADLLGTQSKSKSSDDGDLADLLG